MTQEEVANELGYSRSAISKIESGKNNLTQSKVAKFAQVLKTTPSYLMGYDDNSKNDPTVTAKPPDIYDKLIKLIESHSLSDEQLQRLFQIVELFLGETKI